MARKKLVDPKVAAFRRALPLKWRQTLISLTGKGPAYLSRMVAGMRTDKPEWPMLLELVEKHKEIKAKNEAATEAALAKPLVEVERISA
jgi:hypothetical protein